VRERRPGLVQVAAMVGNPLQPGSWRVVATAPGSVTRQPALAWVEAAPDARPGGRYACPGRLRL